MGVEFSFIRLNLLYNNSKKLSNLTLHKNSQPHYSKGSTRGTMLVSQDLVRPEIRITGTDLVDLSMAPCLNNPFSLVVL